MDKSKSNHVIVTDIKTKRAESSWVRWRQGGRTAVIHDLKDMIFDCEFEGIEVAIERANGRKGATGHVEMESGTYFWELT